jgi:hypothetical protein
VGQYPVGSDDGQRQAVGREPAPGGDADWLAGGRGYDIQKVGRAGPKSVLRGLAWRARFADLLMLGLADVAKW